MDEAIHETHIYGPVHGFVQGENNIINFTFQGSNKDQEPLPIWNVPYQRNPFFTGRETLLKHLYDLLHKNKAAALTQTISGLGGIGKTQIAIEYAYRYRNEYRFVFWVRATSLEVLISDFVTIATLLNIADKDEKDQNVAVAAVKQWLDHHEKWLLILDNVDDLDQIHNVLPTGGNGHILITTRNQAAGSIARSIEVEKLDKQEGTLLLLRRSKVLTPEDSFDQVKEIMRTEVEAIVTSMDGLPLALDQAGAYIEETRCSFASYLDIYHKHRRSLLQRRGSIASDHPEPVATTWSLSFQKVKKTNSAAADILCLCAFLDPDAIPEEIFTHGASSLSTTLKHMAEDSFKLNEAMECLLRFSLIRRNPNTKLLSIHRLVQAVLKDGMSKRIQYIWAERTVKAVNQLFPSAKEEEALSQYQRYLPQAQACAVLMKQQKIASDEGVRLLYQAGYHLLNHALYNQAEPLLQQALTMSEIITGVQHPRCLTILALLYEDQGKYEQAESLFRQALALMELVRGTDHIDIATDLGNLATLYYEQGKYEQAETLLQRAIAIREQVLGPDHIDIATDLNNLATLYHEQGKYEQAEPLFRQAIAIRERVLGPDHLDVATSLNNLVHLYLDKHDYEQGELLLQRALTITERVLGPDHPTTATILNNLGWVYYLQGKYEQAESFYRHALTITERVLGPDHPNTARSIGNLASLYKAQGKYEQAESFLQRTLEVFENTLVPGHPDIAICLGNLAQLYKAQGKNEQAEFLYLGALTIQEKALEPYHLDIAEILVELAGVYRNQGKNEQAEPLFLRALTIRKEVLGLEHSDTEVVLNNLLLLYYQQARYEKAQSLAQQALVIQEKKLGSQHPDIAYSLHILASIYHALGMYEQAESLWQRAIALQEESLGSQHPDIIRSLRNLAELYDTQDKYEQAEPLHQRVLTIKEQMLGLNHSETIVSIDELVLCYVSQGKFKQAEPLIQRALSASVQVLGPNHPDTIGQLELLAECYVVQGKFEKAKTLMKRALTASQQTLGSEHPDTITISQRYAALKGKTKSSRKTPKNVQYLPE